MLRRALFFLLFVLTVSSLSVGQSAPIIVTPGGADNPAIPKPEAAPTPDPKEGPQLKPADLEKRQPLQDLTRMQLIRLLDAEFVHVRKNFPIGEKDMSIEPDGAVKPGDVQLYRLSQKIGIAAKIGDRVQITNIQFREKTIYFEINGGPKKKTKWYQHIEISGMGGAKGGTDPTQSNIPTGGALTIEFKKQVPEMTGAELKQLLRPVLDFTVKTAGEVYMDTFPPKIRDSIKKHEVLVGMNHDMVVMAKDRPQQKVREKDEKGREYEEWIYGTAPQDVVFVRFVGDEVVQVKIAKVGSEIVVKTEKEIDVKDGIPTLASLKSSDSPENVDTSAPPQQQPAHKPTLKRPDEQTPADLGKDGSNASTQPPPDEPQWGTHGKQPPPSTDEKPADNQQKPQQE